MSTLSIQQAMELAMAQHRAGQFGEAEAIYRQVLAKQPNTPVALHMLGLLTLQSGKPEPALELMARAIALNPNVADFHLNHGVALEGLGRTQEAMAAYRKALALKPNIPEAHANLGNSLRKAGQFTEAAAECRYALELRPDYFEAHLNLGNVLQDQGEFDQAITEFQRVVEMRPDFAEGHHNLGNVLMKRGRIDEAGRAQQQALTIKPQFAQAANALGAALREKGQEELAIAAFRHAIAAKPDFVAAMVNLAQLMRKQACEAAQPPSPAVSALIDEAIALSRKAILLAPQTAEAQQTLGGLLQLKGDMDGAILAYRQAIALRPRWVQAHAGLANALARRGDIEAATLAYHETLSLDPNLSEGYHGLGIIHSDQGDYDRAVPALRRAVSLRPDSTEIATLLAATLFHRGDFDEAMNWFRRVLEKDPHNASGHWNLALMLLTRGDFENGWKEYEWRWQVKELKMEFNPAAPLWDGADLAGRRILLLGEQGFGDAIQCARYIPQVAQRGGKLIVAVHAELRRLLQNSLLGRDVLEWVIPDQDLPQYDVYCPLLTLPKVFGTRLETIPANVPYLQADEAAKRQWQARLPSDGRLKVGLAWAGSPRHVNDRHRSIPAELLAPLRDVPNAWFCSMQKGPIARADVAPPLDMADWTSELTDFADTAALLENLDLVICADTALAHLAGAMGKRAWVLLPFLPDWRWMLHRTDSPWYPTMRLFRQSAPGDWTTPIAKMVEALRRAEPAESPPP